MKYVIILFTLCLSQLLFAQKEDTLMQFIDQTDISSLHSNKEKQLYFKRISDLHLGIQNREMEVTTEYGFDSQERDSILELRQTINQFLLEKMREYLSIHPYPARSDGDTIKIEGTNERYIAWDGLACNTIIKVFIHAPDTPENIDLKKLYFPTFYRAYEQKYIYSGHLWNLLHGLYRQVKMEDYINLELAEDEQIEIMINELELKRKSSY
ncbi:MAG: hypothetical protein P8P74_08775 [Crocinitomicaceae bacterium]|nr:hypothetical protein [Crocinitomicaceae bacterium]